MGIFAGCQDRPKAVARMAGFFFSNVAVVVVQVTYQSRVIERREVWRGFASANQRGQRLAAEVFEMGAQQLDGWTLQRAKGAAKGIEYTNLELLARFRREVVIRSTSDESGQLFDLGHCFLFSAVQECFPFVYASFSQFLHLDMLLTHLARACFYKAV